MAVAAQRGGDQAFPADLITIPGGKLEIGSTADELLEVTKQFHPRAPRPRLELLHKLMSELGHTTVEVQPYFLHRTPITNEQYLQFVRASKHRFPFHWWKEGKKEDWESKRNEFREAYKEQRHADMLYWEANWQKLPFAIPEGQEQHPVVFVSWIDAQAFAGWAGMRLPTEVEWLFAATGGKNQQYLWGDDWSVERLKELQLYSARDKKLRPVGALGAFARGPFGHDDMVGNVWEWVADIGYFPLCTEQSYKDELRKLRKNKLAEEVAEPGWNGASRVLKGGSYFSWQAPEEFRLSTRAHMGRIQTEAGAGFRVAKSMIPARDMCRSRIAVEYDASFFGGEREPNIADQIGVERYDLTNGGRLITDYHAVSVVPVNHMGLERNVSLDRLKEDGREKPLVIGTLVTTERLAEPKLEPGMYTIYFRQEGMPKELVDALKEGNRVLMAERKLGKKAKDEPKKDEPRKDEPVEGEGDAGADEKKKGGPDWRAVLARYGITEDEAAEKGAPGKIDFVRLKPGDLQIATQTSCFVFRQNSGDFVAALPTSKSLAVGTYRGAHLSLGGSPDHKEAFTFDFGAPWADKSSKTLVFTLGVQLPDAQDVSRPWRKPDGATIDGPGGTNASRNNLVKPDRPK